MSPRTRRVNCLCVVSSVCVGLLNLLSERPTHSPPLSTQISPLSPLRFFGGSRSIDLPFCVLFEPKTCLLWVWGGGDRVTKQGLIFTINSRRLSPAFSAEVPISMRRRRGCRRLLGRDSSRRRRCFTSAFLNTVCMLVGEPSTSFQCVAFERI